MTKQRITVRNVSEAWEKANAIFPTDYEYDATASKNAGYNVYWSTKRGSLAHINDLGNRIEIVDDEYSVTNIWIDSDGENTESKSTVRKQKSDAELYLIAEKISASIVIRSYDKAGNSADKRRASSKTEKDILIKIIYGALLGLDWGVNTRASSDMAQAIVDTVEFIAMQFMPDCNCYDTVYTPLKKALATWNY